MFKFKVGDKVKIVAGKDKGREGSIERTYPPDHQVLVPGINIYKKHVKGSNTRDGKGGIFDIPRPISTASISLICPKCKKITRVKIEGNKKDKRRVCKKCKENL